MVYEDTILASKEIMIDEITGMYNRDFYDIALTREFYQAKQEKGTFSIMLIKLNDYKNILSILGEKKSSSILSNLRDIIASYTRDADTICTLHHDAFAVIMPDTAPDAALETWKKIIGHFSAIRFIECKVQLHGSITSYPHDARKIRVLIDLTYSLLDKAGTANTESFSCATKKEYIFN
ncbi:GGDEF domain-containing protein [Spirochaetota bacterium]